MIRAAAYCRVSTDQGDQANSFAAQQRYFREYILGQPGWELYEIYADEGITGTSTRKRLQFQRMIRDARRGAFQQIITKEVSRFSRNILDTIAYTRELKALGIGVLFLADRINTLEPESEMLLSFLASLAQEESRRTSQRVVWGQTRQMERGVVFGRSLLGYRLEGGCLTIQPEEARTVRLIFQKYTQEGLGAGAIARYLTEKGYPTHRGGCQWRAGTVLKILKNEKYVGDLVQKKNYTPDYLTHKKQRNTGQVPLITLENHHEPIISRELWELARQRLARNNRCRKGEGGYSSRYLFSGKIRCGVCGETFVSRTKYRSDGTPVRRWCCAKAVREGAAACGVGRILGDDAARQHLKEALAALPIDRKALADQVTDLAMGAMGAEDGQCQIRSICASIARLERKKGAMLESYFAGDLTRQEMLSWKQTYEGRIDALTRQKAQEERNCCAADREAQIREMCLALLEGRMESELFYRSLLERMTVFRDRHLELELTCLGRVFRFSE